MIYSPPPIIIVFYVHTPDMRPLHTWCRKLWSKCWRSLDKVVHWTYPTGRWADACEMGGGEGGRSDHRLELPPSSGCRPIAGRSARLRHAWQKECPHFVRQEASSITSRHIGQLNSSSTASAYWKPASLLGGMRNHGTGWLCTVCGGRGSGKTPEGWRGVRMTECESVGN